MTDGGPIKMSEVAKRKATIKAGSDWQPTEEQEQAAVFEWVTIMRNRLPELDLLRKVESCQINAKN